MTSKNSKKCSICKQIKELSYFWFRKKNRDGLDRSCKECLSKLHILNYNKKAQSFINPLNEDRTCILCGTTQSTNFFYKKPSLSGGFDRKCKKCRLLQTREQEKDPVCKAYRRNYYLVKTHNVTTEEYNALSLKQNNCCLICYGSKRSKGKNSSLFVDHDHSTSKIRGLLCDNCNKGLGHFKDDENALSNAIKYLQATRYHAK